MNDGKFDDDLLNQCVWDPDGAIKTKQSPVDVDGKWATACNDIDDDQHRWWTEEGDCEWDKLDWEIKPWGLFMMYPMELGNGDPKNKPCTKPNLDSSGGFGDRWFMNYMTVKTPSEHTINGTRYDAEISFAHWQYRRRGNLALIISIMVEALDEYPDNPIFEPYVQKWLEQQEKVISECTTAAPTVSPAPTATPLPAVDKKLISNSDKMNQTKGFNGIAFDMKSSANQPLKIDGFGVYIIDIDPLSEVKLEIYTRNGTHVGDIRDSSSWISLGSILGVVNGYQGEVAVAFTKPVIVEPGQTVSFYIFRVSEDGRDDRLQALELTRSDRGTTDSTNEDISLLVGTATNGGAFVDNQVNRGVAFTGTVYYSMEKDQTNEVDTISNATDCDLQSHIMELGNDSVITTGRRIMLAIDAAEKELLISGFGFYLKQDAVQHGGYTEVNVYVQQGPIESANPDDLSSEWEDLGAFNVLGMGSSMTSDLELKEQILVNPGEEYTFLIVQLDEGDDLLVNTNSDFNITNNNESGGSLEVKARSNSYVGFIKYQACANTSRRRLDHGNSYNPGQLKNWDLYPKSDPYRLLPSPWFYKYTGSFSMPMCYNNAYWRIVDTPLHISKRQLNIISGLIADMIDPNTCEEGTVGKPRNDGSGFVDVNRPLQHFFRSRHKLQYCGRHSWRSQRFFNTPRGNTCWELLDNKSLCYIDEWGNLYAPEN